MRKPEDEDYVTHIIQILRARIHGLIKYYRQAQREQNQTVTTVTSWARKEIRSAHQAIHIIKSPKYYE